MTPEIYRNRYKYEIAVICDYHHVPPRELFSRAQNRLANRARKALAREISGRGLSSVQIGIMLGRDHTSVLAMLGRVKYKRSRK